MSSQRENVNEPMRFVYHVDVNSAFLSWEAVKRLNEGKTLDIRTVPAVIGGDPKTRHGVVCAKSIPCKAYGISTGEPIVKAREKCPNLLIFPGDYEWYSECSENFMAICDTFSPMVEPFSVDECFLEMTGFLDANTKECAVKTANRLKDTIRDTLGFTVNIGVAENKLLAKMASDFQKPDRVHTLWNDEVEKKMWPLPVGDLLFVGRSSREVLKKLGIRTIGELAKYPPDVLSFHTGDNFAYTMVEHAQGIDDSPVSIEPWDEKSYSHSFTLPVDVTDEEEIRNVLRHLTDKVTSRMRHDGKKAGLVTAFYKNTDFQVFSRQKKMNYYTSSSDFIFDEVWELFMKLWDHEDPIRLLGVGCANLSDGKFEQMDLFIQEEKEKREKLDAMLDSIRDKYGPDSVKRMRESIHRKDTEKE